MKIFAALPRRSTSCRVHTEPEMIESTAPSSTSIYAAGFRPLANQSFTQTFTLVLAAVSLIGFVVVNGQLRYGRDSAIAVLTGFLLLLFIFLSAMADFTRRRQSNIAISYISLIIGFTVILHATPALLTYIFEFEGLEQAITVDFGKPAASLWLLCTFLSFMLLASQLPRKSARGLLGLNVREEVHQRVLIGYGIGISAALVGLPSLLQPFEQIVGSLRLLPYIAVAAFAHSARATDRRLALLLGVPISLIGIADGFFKPTFWAILVYAIARASGLRQHEHRSLITRAWLTGGCLAFVAVVFVTPIIQTNRWSDQDTVTHISTGYSETWGKGFTTGWDVFADKALGRQAGVVVSITRVLDRVPERIPFKGLEQLAETPFAVVPRFLWPGKPSLSDGPEVSVKFLDAPHTTRSSGSIMIIGDAYWFAGLSGVLTVAIFAGGLIGFVDSRLASHAAVILRISLLPAIADIESSLAQWFAGTVLAVLTCSAFMYWASRPLPILYGRGHQSLSVGTERETA